MSTLNTKDAAVLSKIAYAVKLFYSTNSSDYRNKTLADIFYDANGNLKNESLIADRVNRSRADLWVPNKVNASKFL